ncbi:MULTISPECIES: family 16 glycosylhydrolase [unclassified Paenibacillus]|uniref:family 16 glycosylhydrolase n=1 Tax=unclassified Paenibacillus TaxID=185978 RepID=UPI00240586E8|nr:MULTISPECIES: family 16 glycosylhydrolase [unclassified Paenibacillus]MDF9839801.1 beta-glucanase (GH16 family) [Paenibacillus sp. PastF-2]MDF9846382.1 beta-glucanase (GH16 family) [Paenibacillus sp. PastM-2]MDF9853269.1 beta-glucanase (GH16 family) [Paenibacillus sp. PastF-1]MDH6478227.1 beta-glucanase (GH16 family) [Paenibacillus sp. PastH-2]MDH6506274.1 beta-glucanase (GH16 family) [Paenibacillus sp. PastM-3]
MKRLNMAEPRFSRKVWSLFLALLMLSGIGLLPASKVQAAATTVTSMAYFSAADGPVISKSGVGQASYGFVMPIFNGGAATWNDVSGDVGVKVKKNGNWVDIDSAGGFVYNQNWGHWSDGGANGYWFTLSATTEIQLYSKANSNVTLNYTLAFQNVNTATITSMAATQGPVLTAGFTGSAGFTYPVFNNDPNLIYAAVAQDLKLSVKPVSSSQWVNIDNNAASGWIYDSNFGQFTEGGGGYWFTVTESINVKLESKTSGASLVYTINFNQPVRNSYVLSAYDSNTTYTADNNGSIGFPLPKIDGGAPIGSELGKFVYQIKKAGVWVDLSSSAQSGFVYAGNGYNNMSAANQWGYWADYIYGLWFQPIQENMEIRIGYPLNGQSGGNVGSNYVYYNFIGNPNAPRPDESDQEDIAIGTPSDPAIAGMNLIWQDEFSGTALDTSKWNYETGYYISDDVNSWGWGNAELQHYTNSTQNVFVSGGQLNIRALNDHRSFPQDPNRYAEYSSGKINTKDNLSLQYGRVDIRAKLPTGDGIWPALWMLPEDAAYGAWAASGEIDIMEAKGRLPGTTSGAIHFGGQWPVNRYIAGEYHFPQGQTFANDYHVYTMVWEEDNMKWYVDGKFFFKVTREQWYSVAAPNNPNAPFDQPFYLIMNLAVGGHFDGGRVPAASDIPATMQVDYVRVYKEGTGGGNPGNPGNVAVSGVTVTPSSPQIEVGQSVQLAANVAPANATNKAVSWSVSNPAVASVNASGSVTGLAAGTVTVTATTADGGKTASSTITVVTPPPVTVVIGDSVRGLKKTGNNLQFYVNGATFADLHYKINGGGQLNVAMTSTGNGNFTYPVLNLQQGDTVEYFFTYNPGQGALDTPWQTYVHGVTQGVPE